MRREWERNKIFGNSECFKKGEDEKEKVGKWAPMFWF